MELLDISYYCKLITNDGHIVKSHPERDIDNYLFEHNIKHIYEKGLPYGKNKKDIIHPDFCLPNYLGKGKDVYFEHWGIEQDNPNFPNYKEIKNFKNQKFKDLKVTVVSTNKDDVKDINTTLDRILKKENIKEHKINNDEN